MMQPSARQVGSLIVITANASGNWIEALLPLMRRGAIPTILALDPGTFDSTPVENTTHLLLSKMGIVHHLITPDLLDRPEARPGQRGHWDWRVSPSGRAIAVNRPRDLSWKMLQ
jgi:hypothetical protein